MPELVQRDLPRVTELDRGPTNRNSADGAAGQGPGRRQKEEAG